MSEIETPPLQQHPKVWDPATLVLLVILCVFGAIIGVQLLVSLGVTPNTAIIGAMAAMIVARVPLKFFGHYRSVHVQNLAQSATSAATFGAASAPDCHSLALRPPRHGRADVYRRRARHAARRVPAL